MLAQAEAPLTTTSGSTLMIEFVRKPGATPTRLPAPHLTVHHVGAVDDENTVRAALDRAAGRPATLRVNLSACAARTRIARLTAVQRACPRTRLRTCATATRLRQVAHSRRTTHANSQWRGVRCASSTRDARSVRPKRPRPRPTATPRPPARVLAALRAWTYIRAAPTSLRCRLARTHDSEERDRAGVRQPSRRHAACECELRRRLYSVSMQLARAIARW
jgi:hypothetical protein